MRVCTIERSAVLRRGIALSKVTQALTILAGQEAEHSLSWLACGSPMKTSAAPIYRGMLQW